jgi:SPX domain protein involved in polyphosphate accumulation
MVFMVWSVVLAVNIFIVKHILFLNFIMVVNLDSTRLFQRPSTITNGNFSGCISELYFDDNRIGLHEFKTTSPLCDGCSEA